MKCPICGNTENLVGNKEWGFNNYKVSRVTCPRCGATFNNYSGDSGSYTIPKPKEMK